MNDRPVRSILKELTHQVDSWFAELRLVLRSKKLPTM
jgi:hypothetical protein